MQYLTAWGALVDIGKLSSGDAVIITAASSSVGIAAIQIANMLGAVPIATTRTSSKKAALRDAGAAHVIATEEQDLVAEVKRMTDGKGARIVFDSVAGPQVETLAQAMAREGILFVYGFLSGKPTPFPMSPVMLVKSSSRSSPGFSPSTKSPMRTAIWNRTSSSAKSSSRFLSCGL
jgi:NADPH:quinone reductase-like Zn-dependent oxidoreductase